MRNGGNILAVLIFSFGYLSRLPQS